jgi:hypothetical protein
VPSSGLATLASLLHIVSNPSFWVTIEVRACWAWRCPVAHLSDDLRRGQDRSESSYSAVLVFPAIGGPLRATPAGGGRPSVPHAPRLGFRHRRCPVAACKLRGVEAAVPVLADDSEGDRRGPGRQQGRVLPGLRGSPVYDGMKYEHWAHIRLVN